MPTPEHNPQSIPPSYIPPGLRLCRESEREELPADARIFGNGTRSPHCGASVPMHDWRQNAYITATPLPESEREVPAASPWIPLSERMPSEKDWDETHAVEYIYSNKERATFYEKQEADYSGTPTHWRRVELPPLPPAPAKTQREKDEAMFNRIWEGCECGGKVSRLGGSAIFSSAITAERAHFGGRSSEEVKAELIKIVECCERTYNLDFSVFRTLFSPPKEETP